MLIYYTGIKNIDPVLYEAAAIDGADWKTTFLRITLPLMKPVIQINVTMAIISALKQMETVYLLTNGGPGDATQFAANYLYQQAFKAFKYGYGNAIGVVFIIICILVTVGLNRIFAGRENDRGCGMKKNNVNQKKGAAHAGIGKIVLWIVLLLVAVIQIFPLIWLLDFSLASSTEMFTNGLLILPEKIQWGNYVTAFVDGHFLQYLKNSIIINGLAVFFVLLISIMAAYACRRMRWKLSGLVKTILLLGMMIPIHATLLPNYKIYNTLGLTDTIWALLIPYVAFSLPQGLFLMTGFIDSIPWEMEEAAVMDGCGIYRIVFQIITPMLKPSIATVAIMTFLNNWNEFIMASTYLSTPKWKTLPFSVLEFTGQYSSNYAVQFAVMALTAAPAVIVYILLNKHITKGVAMGAVKG